jgi:cyclic-di-AMP phosphodiesterase PgpH
MNKERKKKNGLTGSARSNKTYGQLVSFATKKETLSVAMILLFVAATLFSMFINPQLYRAGVHEGDVALKDIYAPYDFVYTWGVDEEKTGEIRQKAREGSPYVFLRDAEVEKKVKSRLNRFFEMTAEEQKKEVPVRDKIAELKDSIGEAFPDREIRAILEYPDVNVLRKVSMDTVKNVFLAGYAKKEDVESLKKSGAETVVIVGSETGNEITRSASDILTPDSVKDAISSNVAKALNGDRRTQEALTTLLAGYLTANIRADETDTRARMESLVADVKPVYREWEVKKNEIIISRGQRVTARNVAQLSRIRRVFKPGTTPKFFSGAVLLFGLLGLLAAIYFTLMGRKDLIRDNKSISITVLNMFILIVITDMIMRSPQPSYFIPLAGMGMTITLLVGFNVAFLSVVVMSLLVSLIAGGKIETMLVMLIGSSVGMYAVKDCRRRANILWAGLLVGLANFAAIACVGLINNLEIDYFIKDGLWGIGSGVFSAFLVMGLLPVFEYLFKVPTNISLLELSDLNHPLLKKLAVEAPGTYHHSILVGNLAEGACDAIGANSLLARVGAYYHDIGKIPKAEYFSENEMMAGSRHGNLSPSMSALIISKHVKDGAEMGKKYKLNANIIDFITQHHGNSLISFFYQKAIEKAKDETSLKEENFRYPGPRPQTKEGAIILLADAVEASSRAMEDPTPSSIRNIVKKIINNKFIDGQLDDCNLTLKDMNKIADSFVRVLIGIYHTRLTYPDTDGPKRTSNGRNSNSDKAGKPKPKKKS